MSCAGAGSARAWGPEGHQAIAALAEALLDEGARKALLELLEKDQQLSDFDICVWADNVKKDLKNGHWHYVDIPFEKDDYVPERDGKDGADVIERIAHFTAVLKDKKAEKAERVKALKYLVHFVADLHQPLHCIERDHDQGGNKCLVTMPGKTEQSNLHRVWDLDFVSLVLNKAVPAAYGAKLAEDEVSKMEAGARAKLAAGTATDWALEAHAVGKKDVYEGVKSGDTLTEAYVTQAAIVTKRQMLAAGVRLARVLNETLNPKEEEKTADK
ncbi:MAG: hypothetical protein KIS92_11610 [Planctomycetota bacterium]|nr:hypothetical protein [Planctomycetota bacterium]